MSKKLGVEITWLGHATVLYRSPKGTVVLVDPWIEGNPASPPQARSLQRVDVILITHGHSDHFADCVTVAERRGPDVVCNFEISLYLERRGVAKVHGINKGGSIELGGVRITMVHAIHSSTIRDGDQILPAGEACGYVLDFGGGSRVYHAGDTCVFGDMKLIAELYEPTVAVLPIGDVYTMGPREAAAAARLIGARAVVPIHHSTFPALPGTPAELRTLLLDRPDIEVVALQPGETA